MVVVASLSYLNLAPTGLSPIRNAVSQYGITPFRSGYRVATIAFGLAGVALAVGLDDAIAARGRVTVVAALAVFALARGAISWFPMDAPGSDRTSTGQTHGLLAIVAFGGATIAAFKLGAVLSGELTWHFLAPVSTGLGWAMLASLLAMALCHSSPVLRARFGLIERAFYVLAIGWFAVFGAACVAHGL